MPRHLDLSEERSRLCSPCPGAVRTTLPLPATHHDHTRDPVQQEWGVDLPEEADQQPLALARRRQLPGADAAADVQPGGLGGEALLVAAKQMPGTTSIPGTRGHQCAVPFASVFYVDKLLPNSATAAPCQHLIYIVFRDFMYFSKFDHIPQNEQNKITFLWDIGTQPFQHKVPAATPL